MAKNLDISFLLDFYGDVLTDKQREVMQQYYNDDLSLSEIAENFSITRQGVRDSIKRGEGTILELEQKIGFAKRYRAVQEGIAELEHLTREINFINGNNYNMSEEIKKATDNMLAIISQISDIEDSEA
ncbi:MAG: sigma factor-like helix-turn-helix DNA-binding protein [Oscillospiraceae bacterium]